MVDRVFDDGLQDDARHHDPFDLTFHTLEILNLVGKAHVDDVQIRLHLTDLVGKAAGLACMLHAVAEEVREVFDKER